MNASSSKTAWGSYQSTAVASKKRNNIWITIGKYPCINRSRCLAKFFCSFYLNFLFVLVEKVRVRGGGEGGTLTAPPPSSGRRMIDRFLLYTENIGSSINQMYHTFFFFLPPLLFCKKGGGGGGEGGEGRRRKWAWLQVWEQWGMNFAYLVLPFHSCLSNSYGFSPWHNIAGLSLVPHNWLQ